MDKKETFAFNPDYLVKPGETIEENIECLGMTKATFARHLGVPIGTLHRLVSGEIPLSVEFAMKLESVTNVPAAFWNSLEANYRMRLNRRGLFLAEDRKWLKDQPRKEMIERGWISGETEMEQFLSALSFYRVANRAAWLKVWEAPLAAARVSPKHKVSPSAVAAFVRAGEIEAESITCKAYSSEAFRNALSSCRALASREICRETLLEIRRLCAEAGVAVVYIKSIPGAPLNGVTRWVAKDKAMILLSLRTGAEDMIWFSFFHEARHVLDERKKASFLTGQAWAESPDEKTADAFAADMLLPASCNKEVVALNSLAEVRRFADDHDLSPGIVVGRYRHITQRFNAFGNSIARFTWSEGMWRVA